MPPFGQAMGFGFGGGGGATGGSVMRQNPGLGPSVKMGMQQRMQRHGGMRPPGGIGWGSPQGPGMGMGGGKEGNMGQPPPAGWMGNPQRMPNLPGPMGPQRQTQNPNAPGYDPGTGYMPGRRMGQQPQRPGFGEGTGSNSRTSTDWAQRHPNDPGPMAPRQMPQIPQQNYEQMRTMMQDMGRNPAATPQPMRPDAPDRAYALGQQNNNMRSAFQNRMY